MNNICTPKPRPVFLRYLSGLALFFCLMLSQNAQAQFSLDFDCESSIAIDASMVGAEDSLSIMIVVPGDTSLIDSMLVEIAVKGNPIFWGSTTITTSAGQVVVIPFPGLITNTGSNEEAALYRAFVQPASKITVTTPVVDPLHYDDWQSVTAFYIRTDVDCISGTSSGGDILLFHACETLYFEIDAVGSPFKDVRVLAPISELGDADTTRTAIIEINYIHNGVVTQLSRDTFTGSDNLGGNALLFDRLYSVPGDVDTIQMRLISPDGVFPPFNSCEQMVPFGGDSFIIGTVVVSSDCDQCCSVIVDCENIAGDTLCSFALVPPIPDEFLDDTAFYEDGVNLDSLAFAALGGSYTTEFCDSVYIVASDEIVGEPCGEVAGVVIRTFEFYNLQTGTLTAVCVVFYLIQDYEAPELACPEDVQLACTIADLPPYSTLEEFLAAGGSASDNCALDTLSFDIISEESDGLTCPETITRIYSVADSCGNVATCIHVITVWDQEPPSITCPEDVIVECPGSTDPADTGSPLVSDNCTSAPFVTYSDTVEPGRCPQEYTILRRWSAEDDCGNVATCIQTISVVDTTPPFITCPEDITVDCVFGDDPESAGFAFAFDNCGDTFVTYADVVTPGDCPQEYTVLRTWYAQDECGNVSTCVQSIFVDDSRAPSLTIPEDITLQCGEIPVGEATAFDDCGDVFITYMDLICTVTVEGFTGDYDFANWTASAPFGGEVVTSGDESVTLTGPNDGNCPGGGGATSFSIVVPADGKLVFAWNYATNDIDGPSFDPFGYSINGAFVQLSDNGGGSTQNGLAAALVSAGDVFAFEQRSTDCIFGAGATTLVDFFVYTCSADDVFDPCNYTIFRCWSATDACGNAAYALQRIHIEDTIAPSITCPEDARLECDESTDPANTGVAIATDNCSDPSITYADVVTPGDCPYSYTITRTWYAEDECGNVASCIQIITVEDTTAPVFAYVPEGYSVECTEDAVFDDPMVTDNCSDVSLTYADMFGYAVFSSLSGDQEVPPNASLATGTLTGIYNTATRMLFVHVVYNDLGSPVTAAHIHIAPAGVNGPIIEHLPIAFGSTSGSFSHSAILSEANGDALLSEGLYINIHTMSFPPGEIRGQLSVSSCDQVLKRTWTASDDCGNVSIASSVILISDTTPPSITCPDDVTIECDESTDPAITGVATATDNCADVSITYVDVVTPGNCAQEYTIARTWYAQDECGNVATCVQTISVVDTTPPSITCPETIVMECGTAMFGLIGTSSDGVNAGSLFTIDTETGAATLVGPNGIGTNGNRMAGVDVDPTTGIVYAILGSAITGATLVTLDPASGAATVVGVIIPDLGDFTGSDALAFASDGTLYAGYWNGGAGVLLRVDKTDGSIIEQLPVSGGGGNNHISGLHFAPNGTLWASRGGTFPGRIVALDHTTGVVQSIIDLEDINGNAELVTISDLAFGADGTLYASLPMENELATIDLATGVLTRIGSFGGDVFRMSGLGRGGAAAPVVTDNCDPAPFLTYSEVSSGDGCSFTIERTWTAIDACGNSASCVQLIQVIDSTPPSISCPADLTLECTDSTDPISTGFATAVDNCGDATVTYADLVVPGDCAYRYTILRTWIAADECGNIATCVQTISVDDITPPSITCPPDATFDCTAGALMFGTYAEFVAAGGSASDNCELDESSFELISAIGVGPCPTVFSFTYRIADVCGNVATCVHLVLVNDETPPSITCPEDVVVECSVEEVPVYETLDEFLAAGGNVSDDCAIDSLSFTLVSEVSDGLTCPETVTRTYSIADFCGNVSTCVQTITINDTTPPVITCSADITIECSDLVPEPFVSATDNCDPEVDIFPASSLIPGDCPGNYTIFRSWQAIDDCGNVAICTQTITVIDSTPPDITCPEDVTLTCVTIDDLIPGEFGFASATDNCDPEPAISYTDEVITGRCDYDFTVIRTWIATDACGNSSSCVQVITVEDNTAPFLTVPEDVTIECGSEFVGGLAGATDNCDGDVFVTYMDLICEQTVQDFTGDYDFANWTITLSPFGGSVETTGDESVTLNGPDGISCPGSAVTFSITVPEDGKLIFSWNYTTVDGAFWDPFGYSINGIFVPLTDASGPNTQSGLGAALVSAGDVFAFEQRSVDCILGEGVTTVIDFFVYTCDGVVPEDACEFTVFRCWSAADACGNTAYALQRISVMDTQAPSITCPEDITVDCSENNIDPDVTGLPIVSDLCSDVTVTYYDSYEQGNCLPEYTVTRLWVATDACGNVSSCVQNIMVVDDNNLTITCPANITVSCANAVPLPDPASVIAMDNCSGVMSVVHVSDVISNQTCANRFTITRTYQATDGCGNTATCAQIITVNDVTPPTIVCPANITVSCASLVPAPNTGSVTTSDNCPGTVTVTHISDVITNQTCPNRFTVNRTYRATDVCGNTMDCVQLIVVNDVTPPTIVCPPDITLLDGDTSTGVTGNPTGSDNCGGTPMFAFTDMIIPGICELQFTVNRTWVATDACGNTSSCLQVIEVAEECPCELICPDNITVNLLPGFCDAKVKYPDPQIVGAGCPMEIFIPTTVTQNTNTTLIQDALQCGVNPTSHWRAYDLAALGVTQNFQMNSLGMASWSAGTVQVFVYSYTGPMPPSATLDVNQMTLVGQSAPMAVGGFSLTTHTLTVPVLMTPGTNYVVEQRQLAGGPWCIASNYAGNSQPAYMNCIGSIFGFPAVPTSYPTLGYGFIHPIQVLNGAFVQPGGILVQTEGLPSGSVFPVGTTTNCFELIDGVTGELIDDCCFDVVVNEYSGPIVTSLVCNNLINISLNENCELTLYADLILEGGPYRCYDSYIVNVDQYGTLDVNGIPITLTFGMHTVTVIDPETGNSCWGKINVEDKMPPVLECMDFTLPCGTDLTPVFTPPIMGVSTCSQFPGLPIGQGAPGNVTTSTCTVSLPVGVEIVDVNVCVKITHTWIGDCYVQLVSPTGAVTDLWGFGQCGPTQGMHQKFDDDGPQVVLCADINNGCGFILQPVATQLGTPSLDQYITGNPNGTWTLMVTDIFPPADNGTLDEWHLEIEYAQNAPFAPTVSDNCDNNVTLVYSDEEVGELCDGTQQVIRTWTATDDAGNSTQCIQNLFIEPLSLVALQFPDTYIGECGGTTHPNVTGWPTVDGIPISGGHICNVFLTWEDKELADCGAGTKIVRTWTVLDWCEVEVRKGVQIIKLSDEQAPVMTCPANVTVGTNPWFCYQHVNLALPNAVDACGTPFTLTPTVSAGTLVHFGGNNYRVDNLPIGTHTVTWRATDACGNSSTCTYTITVVDNIAPVPICDAHTVVSITFDDPLDQGLTKIFAETFDDGSYDNCGPVTFLVRRMASCINFDWIGPNGEYPNSDGIVASLDRGLTFQPWVPFACCDVGAGAPGSGIPPVMVELRVTDQYGNINSCMVEVNVQDKLAPFILCPPNITVSCEYWFDAHETNGFQPTDGLESIFGRILDAYEFNDADRQSIIIHDPGNTQLPQPYNWGRDGWTDDNCDAIIDVRTLIYDDCSGDDLPGVPPANAVRLIERTWRSRDAQGNTSTCRQLIWVVDYKPFFITDQTCFNPNPNDGVIWPCDREYTNCPDVIPVDYPTIFDDNCSLIGVTYEDQVFYFVDGACFKIIRTWIVIDWCQFNPFTLAGYWTYPQVIKVNDHTGPAFTACPTSPITLCVADPNVELPSNNQVFLGEDDPNSSSCSVHVWMEQQVFEACSDEVWYDVKIYPFNGTEFIQIVARRSVPVDDSNIATLTFDTRTNSLPANHPVRRYGLPYNDRHCSNWPLPGGTKDYHRVLWSVEDGCGNSNSCSYLFRLEDCKQPTPVCVGLSSVVMPSSGSVVIWAKDFNASSFDDCTPAADLLYSFSGTVYQPSREFNCQAIEDNGSPSFLVQIWVGDEGNDQNCNGFVNPLGIEWSERNKDFCTTFIVIDDNTGICGDGLTGGVIETELREAVEKVHVKLVNQFGQVMSSYITDKNGTYHFINPLLDHTIEPSRNDDHKNGVSTLDLVAIQKHLLGLKQLDSPYKLIAADANNSQSVSTLDMVEIRKLILGLYVEFPKNTSWRFVDASYDFADPTQPWPFNEIIGLQSGMTMHEDFIAVKVGDVNGTVAANATQVTTRGASSYLKLRVEDLDVYAGQVIEVPVMADNYREMIGYQFTMETAGLKYDGIEPGALAVLPDFVADHKTAITMSWGDITARTIDAEEVLFTLRFTAGTSGKLSDMLKISSRITDAEAYYGDDDVEIMDVALLFGKVLVASPKDYALYQNEPNPFADQTIIGFDLPEAMSATLTMYDMLGRVILVVEGDYAQGYNQVIIRRKDLRSDGAYYYSLQAGEFTASKKLLLSGSRN